MTESFGKI